MTGFIEIDGVPLPTPAECALTEYDFDAASTTRTEAGVMHRDRVRAKVLTADNIKWENLTPDECVRIRQSLLPVTITVRIRVPWGETARSMTAGDLHWTPNFDRDGTERWDLSTKLSEN